VHIGQFLPPRDLVGKMPGTSKEWSKVNWNLLYENMTPTNDPIAVFKKIDEEKFFLEDPKNLLGPAINGFKGYRCWTIDFSTATWGTVLEYSILMRNSLRNDLFNRLFSENATTFMKALATSAAQNCPLDFKIEWGYNPLIFAVIENDVDVGNILLQRGAGNEPRALASAIANLRLELVKILLENGADVHAESGWGEPIHEYCALCLQMFEKEHDEGYTSLYDLNRMKGINKLVMDKKEKTTI